MKHNGVSLEDMTLDQLTEVFALHDELKHYDQAAAVLAEIQRRSDAPAPVVHELPKWLYDGWLSRLWAQKPVGEGSDTRMVRPPNYIKPS